MESLVMNCDCGNCKERREIDSSGKTPDGWIKIQSLTLNGNTIVVDSPNKHKTFAGQSCLFYFISKQLGGYSNGK
jgi:hypothetical protein